MKYRHLFFDLDHTLWDFEENSRETLEDLYGEFRLSERGVPDFHSFHQTYVRHNELMWDRFRKGYVTREELRWKRISRTLLEFRIGDDALVRGLSDRYLEILPTKKHLFSDTRDLLDYLRTKDYPMHLITNGFERTQQLKLHHSGIDTYFTHMVTSEAAGSLKPRPEIFRYALEKAGCTAADALMVGDALEVDILGARNVGMDQAYFNPAVPPAGILPTYTLRTLSDLKEIL